MCKPSLLRTSAEPHGSSGSFIEVWGAQLMGGGEQYGNSSYAVDGSQSPNNTILLSSISSVLPSILFSTSRLGTDLHTLKFANGGVQLYIAHFKVQDTQPVTSILTTTSSGGPPQSAQSPSGITYTTASLSASTGNHFILRKLHCIYSSPFREHATNC